MHSVPAFLGFPIWLVITHFINFVFIFLLIRSGIQILADHPRLYLNDDCTPGSEWIKLTRRQHPRSWFWTSMEEAVDVSSVIALPGGRHNLGVGRHWHFFCVFFWILNGIAYWSLLFITGNWRRLIPISADIFSRGWHTFLSYATFHMPPLGAFRPYDPLQQLVYAFLVFVLAPLSILSGAAMSPAIAARFPRYPRLFGGRQKARSLHFLLMVGYVTFFIIHVTLVALTNFAANMDKIVLAGLPGYHNLAIAGGMLAIVLVVVMHVILTWWSHRSPRKVQRMTGAVTDWLIRVAFYRLRSKQEYPRAAISPYFWVNGWPPEAAEWIHHLKEGFANWKLEVKGLVEQPLKLSMVDIRAMTEESHVTEHVCIQGWSGFAEWSGVPLDDILKLCKPLENARFLIFHSFQIDENGYEYYGSLGIEEATYPQTILAYDMNGESLLAAHGVPLRLRVETKLGFKMVKWIKWIELVEDYRSVGQGQGGYREDLQYYGTGAEI